MSKEPTVDPYFLAEFKSKDQKRIEDAIIMYLSMYLKPETVDKIVFVNSEFFITDENRGLGVPTIKGYQDIAAPEIGYIIFDIDSFILAGFTHQVLHNALLFLFFVQHIIDHPEDKKIGSRRVRFEKDIMSCFTRKLFGRDYGVALRILYVSPDLSGLYESNSPGHLYQEVRILKIDSDSDTIVIYVKGYYNNYSIVSRYKYQEDFLDEQLPEIVETQLSFMEDDNLIELYKSGRFKWLTDLVFASSIGWTDDTFVYAIYYGSDDLIRAFITRNPKRVTKIVQTGKINLREEFITNRLNILDPLAIKTVILKRKIKQLDGIFMSAKPFSITDLKALFYASRYDLLDALPLDKIDYSRTDEDEPLSTFIVEWIETTSEKINEDMKNAIRKYWPVANKFSRGLTMDTLTYRLNIDDNIELYDFIRELDPGVVTEWMMVITPRKWHLLTDSVYKRLMTVYPITEPDIRNFIDEKKVDDIDDLKYILSTFKSNELKKRIMKISDFVKN